jgi:hypothetical protein
MSVPRKVPETKGLLRIKSQSTRGGPTTRWSLIRGLPG